MKGVEVWMRDLVTSKGSQPLACTAFVNDGLFLESGSVPSFIASFVSLQNTSSSRGRLGFSSVTLSGTPGQGFVGQNENEKVLEIKVEKAGGALNTTKHLWAGAVSAMVSRTFVAPLERLKLEYMVRGEQKHLIELIQLIAASQGIKGFIAGAAAGITATVLCIPMDTIRTKMVAPGGETLGGVIGAFCHMIQTEGFFSLYKGLVPSIISMAPSGAVFYGIYDILKSTYLHSPKGRKRLQHMKEVGQNLNALDNVNGLNLLHPQPFPCTCAMRLFPDLKCFVEII
ncbi:hypothetical protein L1987_18739 [Smallanthus sonchifolius]|uniref:Uncharacterized protein n=1 Tax=Smallanthus sonchifolius TaxID=185202 RepID=A0ACB9J2J5_9ASTR|nr:hypothetical protein L1987_18739 [Smallanthus sonchifolius]